MDLTKEDGAANEAIPAMPLAQATVGGKPGLVFTATRSKGCRQRGSGEGHKFGRTDPPSKHQSGDDEEGVVYGFDLNTEDGEMRKSHEAPWHVLDESARQSRRGEEGAGGLLLGKHNMVCSRALDSFECAKEEMNEGAQQSKLKGVAFPSRMQVGLTALVAHSSLAPASEPADHFLARATVGQSASQLCWAEAASAGGHRLAESLRSLPEPWREYRYS